MEIHTYTPDLTRPMCPDCGSCVSQTTHTPETPWVGTCERGHTHAFQLDAEVGEWLEDSKTGRFSRHATQPEESTWICNTCGAHDADPRELGCLECGTDADFFD